MIDGCKEKQNTGNQDRHIEVKKKSGMFSPKSKSDWFLKPNNLIIYSLCAHLFGNETTIKRHKLIEHLIRLFKRAPNSQFRLTFNNFSFLHFFG